MNDEMKPDGRVNTPLPIALDTARRLLEIVDAGLCAGPGYPKPGNMCAEAAVCYALGQPHGDQPTCVHPTVRAHMISLNDSSWSDDQARAKGLRRVAIAQLGTADTLDGEQFKREFRVAAIQRCTPLLLRAAATIARKGKDENQAAKIENVAAQCEAGIPIVEAQAAMRALHAYAYAYAHANANAYADAYANAYANAHAYANADADAYANAYADANANARDKFLGAVADSVEAALRACNSPGIALLDQLLPVNS